MSELNLAVCYVFDRSSVHAWRDPKTPEEVEQAFRNLEGELRHRLGDEDVFDLLQQSSEPNSWQLVASTTLPPDILTNRVEASLMACELRKCGS